MWGSIPHLSITKYKGKEMRKTIKNVISVFVFTLVFSVDAEVARIDRANGIAPRDCVFKTNCWKGDLT